MSFKINRERLVFILAWMIIPVLFIVSISCFSGKSIVLERYALWGYPALAILAALMIRHQNSSAARTLALVVLGCFLLVRVLDKRWYVEDWRGAIAEAKSWQLPLFVNTGLVESRNLEWLQDPSKQRYFLAPLSHYGNLNNSIPLPFNQDISGASQYLDGSVASAKFNMRSVAALCLSVKGADCGERYFESQGLRAVETKNFGLVRLIRLESPK